MRQITLIGAASATCRKSSNGRPVRRLRAPAGRSWNPGLVSKRLKTLAAQAGMPVIKLHEVGRHTGNSPMRDAGVDQEVRMREVGHAGRDINDRYTHVLIEAHLAAAEQTAALIREARKTAP